ncbi:hypothetical protein PVA45_07715 (plasmid) [Entomospira entomophila]|uniref:DUF4340 domain-containing protein n=1 Tax=Entomospira entomophila TaxID=2719988 RepID=A0A968GA43_9SPIO|nr:hypothetical protein [Entomospira entomophilus]NIZ41390.1 hypothetical protein [Entomospira entomophilus]WDI36340.1 hypothetical protein PVA45_07715 [Entomospira entomophilus]
MQPLSIREKRIVQSIFIVGAVSLLIITHLIFAPALRSRSIQRKHFDPHQLQLTQAMPMGNLIAMDPNRVNTLTSSLNFWQMNQWQHEEQSIEFDSMQWGFMMIPSPARITMLDAEDQSHNLLTLIQDQNRKESDFDWSNIRLDTLQFNLTPVPLAPTTLLKNDGKPVNIPNMFIDANYRFQQITFYTDGVVIIYDIDLFGLLEKTSDLGALWQTVKLSFRWQDGVLIQQDPDSTVDLGAEIITYHLNNIRPTASTIKTLEHTSSAFNEIAMIVGEQMQAEQKNFSSNDLSTETTQMLTRMSSNIFKSFQKQVRRSGFLLLNDNGTLILSGITHIRYNDDKSVMILQTHHGLYHLDLETKGIHLVHPQAEEQTQTHKWIKL